VTIDSFKKKKERDEGGEVDEGDGAIFLLHGKTMDLADSMSPNGERAKKRRTREMGDT